MSACLDMLDAKIISAVSDGPYYRVLTDMGEVVVPRVTSITSVINKPFLAKWRGKIGNEAADKVMKDACDLGHAVHELCHRYSMGEKVEFDKTVIGRLAATWGKWFDENVEEVILAETTLISLFFGFGGTLDQLVRLKKTSAYYDATGGRLMVLDIKTSTSVDVGYEIQTASYAVGLREQYPGRDDFKSVGRMVVRLKKENPDANPQVVIFKRDRELMAEKAFFNALDLKEFIE